MSSRKTSAFTLTEILIVIGLIVLMLGLAVAAFNGISSGKSVGGATNILSAFLGQARSTAIQSGKQTGVLFFRDPATQRTRAIMVRRVTHRLYKLDDPQQLLPVMSYKAGDTVYTPPVAQVPPVPPLYFVCVIPHDATAANRPRFNPPPEWAYSGDWFIEEVPNVDDVTLPSGVGVQTVYADDQTYGPTGLRVGNGYLRQCGLILFGASGQVVSEPYGIHYASRLGVKIGLTQSLNPSAPLATASSGFFPQARDFKSQLGIVLYEMAAAENIPLYTERDYFDATKQAAIATPLDSITPGNATNATIEATKETWLDQNSIVLLVNRYNGTLVKGE